MHRFPSSANRLWATLGLGLALLANSSSASESTTYSYDALGRMTTVSSSSGVNQGVSISFTYDPAGNRLTRQVSGQSVPSRSISAQQAIVGQPIGVSAQIPGATSGTVSFYAAGNFIGSASIQSGSAAITTVFNAPGVWMVMARAVTANGTVVVTSPVQVAQ